MLNLILLLSFLCTWALGQNKVLVKKNETHPTYQDTQRRLALVIGNKDYIGDYQLANPENDADDMATTLEGLGFKVIKKTNLDGKAFKKEVDGFGKELVNYDVALFYYSGYGIEFNKLNYLVPIDVQLSHKSAPVSNFVSLDSVMLKIKYAKVQTSIVFLDASRSNTLFASKSMSLPSSLTAPNQNGDTLMVSGTDKGKNIDSSQSAKAMIPRLDFSNNFSNSIIVFATEEGKNADDNPKEKNGLFTAELLKNLKIPNITLQQMIAQTRNAKSNQKQLPATYDKLLVDFYFTPKSDLIKLEIEEGKIAYKKSNFLRAFELLTKYKSSPLLDTESMKTIGDLYINGLGTEPNLEQFLYWYTKAGDLGDIDAQATLGSLYFFKIQDYKSAMMWYGKAAEQGNVMSQNNLGQMYEKGIGIESDNKTAVHWYRKAAEQGNSSGQNNLGYMYYLGKGIEQDYKIAVMWFRKAAEQGNSSGQYNLGNMYEAGKGVNKNLKKAIELYKQAAKNGNSDAQLALDRQNVN
jgi:TPR repeat protein